jgi:N-acyl-D-aspartate/D-glutamate deacylase
MVLDVAIRGATVVDGTGAPGRRADVGVRDGLIGAVGVVDEGATIEIDADGLTVTPGFVDGHTHYDAQLWWDPTCAPSPCHGVTTVVAGNCGFTLAPVADGDEEFLTRLLAHVEGMSLAALETGVPFGWRTFGDLLDAVERHGVAINVAFMVGHAAVRRAVMGVAASERVADSRELDTMRAVFDDALRAGGLGLSSATVATQTDGDGRPTPPTFAAPDELIALAGVCRDHPGTCLEFTPGSYLAGFTPEDAGLMADMSVAADRHLNWNPVMVNRGDPQLWRRQLAASDLAQARGGLVVPFVAPQNAPMQHDFLGAYVFRALPGWSEVFGLEPAARCHALADPSVRARLVAALAEQRSGLAVTLRDNWGRYVVNEVPGDAQRALVGRTISDLAAERGTSHFDTILDVAVAGALHVGFVRFPYPADDEWLCSTRAELMHDPRVVLGASDAGAHLDMMVGADFPTRSIAELVRERQVFTLEQFVHRITDVPARLFGLRGRGRIEPGAHADLVVLDPERVAAGPLRTADDLPGGASRLTTDAVGVPHVLVGGRVIVRDGVLTGARPGRVLRSGRDTVTVPAATTLR